MSQVLADVLLDEDASRSDKLRAIRAMVNIEGAESDREADELADPNSTRSQEIAATADEAREQLAAMLVHPVTGERLRASLEGLLAEAGDFDSCRLLGDNSVPLTRSAADAAAAAHRSGRRDADAEEGTNQPLDRRRA